MTSLSNTTDHVRILNWLANGEWHCSTEIEYMRDARKRISELVKNGHDIQGIPCDGRCGHVHKSKNLKMRRLVPRTYAEAEATRPRVLNRLFQLRKVYD